MRLLMLAEARNVHTQRWARALSAKGWQVAVLSRSIAEIPGVQVMRLRVPRFGVAYPHRWWRRYSAFLARAVQRVNPDVVHIHYLQDHPMWWLQHPSDAMSRPAMVISTWGSDVDTVGAQLVEDADSRERKVNLLRAADAVTATTRYLARHTAAYAELAECDITVIPFGVDLTRFRPGPESPDRTTQLTVGFVKHLESYYGADYLVRAVPQVVARFPDVRFVIVGDGSMRDSLHRLADELGMADYIDWRGAVPHDDIPGILSEFDVFAMPSLSEAFGVSAVEAQAMGVPVVAFDVEGVDEAVQDGVGGILVSRAHHENLAQAIGRLLGDAQLRSAMGRRGCEFARAHFDFDVNVAAMEEVYDLARAARASRMQSLEVPCSV